MSIEYLVDGRKYLLSYQDLKESYLKYNTMSADEFKNDIPGALHLACVICFLKEIPTYVCLSDEGIIHQLTHLLHIPDEPLVDLRKIRELFRDQLLLA